MNEPPREQAKELIQHVQRIMSAKDDLIYELHVGNRDDFDDDDPFEIRALRALSGGGNYVSVWIEISAYNVRDPNEILTLEEAAALGCHGAEISTHNRHPPSVEVYNHFQY